MGAQVPLVMALDDAGAVPGVVGGKGASLVRVDGSDGTVEVLHQA